MNSTSLVTGMLFIRGVAQDWTEYGNRSLNSRVPNMLATEMNALPDIPGAMYEMTQGRGFTKKSHSRAVLSSYKIWTLDRAVETFGSVIIARHARSKYQINPLNLPVFVPS